MSLVGDLEKDAICMVYVRFSPSKRAVIADGWNEGGVCRGLLNNHGSSGGAGAGASGACFAASDRQCQHGVQPCRRYRYDCTYRRAVQLYCTYTPVPESDLSFDKRPLKKYYGRILDLVLFQIIWLQPAR